MYRYTQRVCDSILPLSIADTLPKAFEEWRFTEEVVDHEEPVEICQLCGQEQLRYHFGIENEFNRNTLWVGSHCILKFSLAVYDEGRRLTDVEAKKKLDKLTEKMRLESCVKALEKLAATENNPILNNALEYYKKNKKLSPKFAFVVFWKLNDYQIDHNPSFFKVSLRRQQHIDDLAEMPTDRVHVFWRSLSSSQRQLAIDLGHLSPPERPAPLPGQATFP